MTNFENSKKVLDNIKLELPETPNINDIKLIKLNREKVENEIIKPKDDKIMEYQLERDSILADNRELHNQVNNIKAEYKEKEDELEYY